ncbi:hypothetical protein TWF192_004562 [Orbilia oligospora]|nr:hypothetical protein TWF192_004562 [Orbilia oligospora]
MVIKRKRSEDDDAMSICSTSSDHSSNNVMMVDQDAITQHHIPLGVNSRTLKRYRDSRPDEKSVHNYTLSKLYSAQRPSDVQQAAPQSAISPAYTPTGSVTYDDVYREPIGSANTYNDIVLRGL